MPMLFTPYMGLKLKNPIIVGSSGMSGTVEGVKKLETQGAGAVVLKSIFEEEILYEMDRVFSGEVLKNYQLERYDYYDYQIRKENLSNYTQLIQGCKKEVSIPVIASINCTYSHEWTQYANQLQSAGADGLELNLFFLPLNFVRSSEETEKLYFDIVQKIKREISIPVALKISHYFTNLGSMIQKLSDTGISALVLFNRFYQPDIDIDTMRIRPSHLLSSPEESLMPLRWTAIMSQKVRCDLAASTGIHDGKAVIKQLLAGARAVQIVSTLYRNGVERIPQMLAELEAWMTKHGFETIEQFRGMMSQEAGKDPGLYERVQFMKYFGDARDTI
jgi:dihydroorotate dehydrogenase (fumarate)